jgi:hypothetical protein
MPRRSSWPHRAGRRRGPATLAITLAAGLFTTGLITAGMVAGTPTDADAADKSPAATEALTGVVERLSVETETETPTRAETPTRNQPQPPPGHPARTTTITGWIRSATGHVQVPASALDGIPTGATVTVQLDPARRVAVTATDGATPITRSARSVRSIRVLATARPPVKPAVSAGPQSVTVLMALPRGARPDTASVSALASTIGTGVARYWSQQSGGKVTFSIYRRVGWTTLSHSCSDIWGLWDEARTKIGFVSGARRHLVVYVPPGAGCPTGLGTVGEGVDAGGNVLVGGSSVGLLAHELGHNLGLGHSNALKCPDTSDGVYSGSGYAGGCESVEYGDWYDVMGISWDNLGTLSTGQAYRLGLLGATQVRNVSAPARVALRAVSGHTGLQSLRIHDPSGATYLVEYRPASGADAWLNTSADWRQLRPGVLVRRIDPADPTQTLLLDPTPSATDPDADWDVALTTGLSLTAASGRVGVLVEATTTTSAVISVQVDGAWPSTLVEPGGRLINGAQVTVGEAPAMWAAAAL